MPSFHILIATIGRPTLQRMLNSLLPQLTENDHITVVFDGFTKIPTFDFSIAKCGITQYCEPNALGFFGHGIRTKYSHIIEKRDFVVHIDDDDYIVGQSFDKFRLLCTDTNILYISRMVCNNGRVVVPSPNTTTIKTGNIGTPCGIIPFDLNSKAEWLLMFGGDGAFYEKISTLCKFEFLNVIHYIIRPDINGFHVPSI